MMNSEIIYRDKLITITENEFVFHNYYFPISKDKAVELKNIKYVLVKKPTLRNGKWRLHGTGNFKVWFSKDYSRPKRDRIFLAILTTQWVNIGFTAENGEQVESILRSKGLIREK